MSFYSESAIKATRKLNRCSGCGRQIDIGSPALRYSGKFDGEFASHIHHPECREAEIALNRLHDVRDGEEWMALTDMESDDWPWLLADYPSVAERMGITAEKIHENEEERARMHAFWIGQAKKRQEKRP